MAKGDGKGNHSINGIHRVQTLRSTIQTNGEKTTRILAESQEVFIKLDLNCVKNKDSYHKYIAHGIDKHNSFHDINKNYKCYEIFTNLNVCIHKEYFLNLILDPKDFFDLIDNHEERNAKLNKSSH